MKRIALLLTLILAIVATGVVLAQDETQLEDPKENACYDGGDLAGKCDWPTDAEDEWAWECGWYYAGFMSGKFSATPERCDILFAEIEDTAVDLCVDLFLARAMLGNYVRITGYPNQPGNATLYGAYAKDAIDPCSEEFALPWDTIWMQTASEISHESAVIKCSKALATKDIIPLQMSHKSLTGFNFVCVALPR